MKNAAYNTTFNGKKIRKSVNYWYVFLCSMLKNLKTGGNLGVILPASWDYADYNLSMREYLPSQFRSFEVFRSQNPLFKGVGDGSVVIIGKGYKKSHKINNRFECNDYNTLIESLNNKECLMQAVHLPKKLNTNKTIETIQFRDIADVHIGAVTGDVAYFLFKEKDIRENNLPIEAFLPILSRANHLMTPDMTPEYWNQLREKSERLWLFYPNNNIIHDPNVQRYLNLPKIDGGCNRDAYQVKKRTTWYLVNIPTKADGFISGMSNTQPFITINSIPSLIASNTLYIVNFHENSLIYKYSWSLSLLTSISQESIELNSRIYGGGLKKHEPKDILNTIIPIMKEDENAKSDYIIACNAFVNGDKDTARKIADSYIK